MSIPISTGSGVASVAAEAVGGLQYQQIQLYGEGGTSILGINPDRSAQVSVIGIPVFRSVGSVITIAQSSVAVAIISGSVAATVTPAANQSVSGTVGASILGNVNTTITSVATANGGLPVYAELTRRVQGVADLRVVQGGSVAALSAPGANIRTYITNIQVANFGSSSVLVKISDNTTSTLGWTIAPAGGGSNYEPFYRSAANSPITASINGTASVLVSMQGFTSNI